MLGSLLSAAGFCFAKATTRTATEQSLEDLHRTGVVQRLRLLQRDANAALKRLAAYYHSQAESLDFPAGLDLYEVIIDDVDEALANVDSVLRTLGIQDVTNSALYEISPVMRQMLVANGRSVREALNRRQRTHDWLTTQVRPSDHPSVWGRFRNLTSDLLKAHFALRALCVEPLRVAPEEQVVELIGYLKAADDRASEFRKALQAAGLEPPDAFETMVQDLRTAKAALTAAQLSLPDAERAKVS